MTAEKTNMCAALSPDCPPLEGAVWIGTHVFPYDSLPGVARHGLWLTPDSLNYALPRILVTGVHETDAPVSIGISAWDVDALKRAPQRWSSATMAAHLILQRSRRGDPEPLIQQAAAALLLALLS